LSRHDRARLGDIAEAISVIQGYLERGDLNDGLIYDAVRVRLIEIGEAVKAISPDLLEGEPTIPWREIARMRDHLAHHYFDTDHAIVQDVVDTELAPLLNAVRTLIDRVDGDAEI
jgi:uncharacterized protein with HEPN domain